MIVVNSGETVERIPNIGEMIVVNVVWYVSIREWMHVIVKTDLSELYKRRAFLILNSTPLTLKGWISCVTDKGLISLNIRNIT